MALLILPESEVLEVGPSGLESEVPPDPGMDLATLEVTSRRHEIAAADAAVEAASANVRLTRAARLPDVTATGGYKRQSDGFRGAFLGVAIPISLFNRSAGAVAGAEARVGAMETRLKLTRRQIDNDLRRAVETYESLKRRSDLLGDEELDASSDLLQIAQVAYDLGEMELLELLDAAGALRGARSADAQVKADLWTAYYNLERAMGGFDIAAEPSTTVPEIR
ncbi:MAG: TolC family protein [Myxococcales bacterium]|nr:MAG: TolC family protein [Myxococcales bacterium]